MERKHRRDEKLREKQMQSVSFSFHACPLVFGEKKSFVLFCFISQLIGNFILYQHPNV